MALISEDESTDLSLQQSSPQDLPPSATAVGLNLTGQGAGKDHPALTGDDPTEQLS